MNPGRRCVRHRFSNTETLEYRTLPAALSVNSLADRVETDGELTLREAINIVNAAQFDVDHTLTSTERLQVTGTLGDNDIILFDIEGALSGTARLQLTGIGGVREGNSAFVISRPLIIQGPEAVTLQVTGLGSDSDLRGFFVQTGGALTLMNLELTDWSTDGSGGSLFVEYGASAVIDGCTLARNEAFFAGGAIYGVGDVTLTDSTLDDNKAREGGALALHGDASVTRSTLSNNSAVDGGAFHVGGNTYAIAGTGVSLTDCVLSGNTAEDRGGAGFLTSSQVVLLRCEVIGNSAYDGGGFASMGGGLELLHSNVAHNSAVADGGGLFLPEGNGGGVQVGGGGETYYSVVDECTISDNFASRGGGVFSQFGLKLTNSTLGENRATTGAGLYHEAQPLHLFDYFPVLRLENVMFSVNRAQGDGGGAYLDGTSELVGCTFQSNTASRGGAVFNKLSSTALEECTVTWNSSSVGSELFNLLGVMTVTDSTGTISIGPATPAQAAAFAQSPPENSRFVNAPAGSRYAISTTGDLWRFLPEVGWNILDDRVLDFRVSPKNGDVYWRNDRKELFRAEAGYGPALLGSDVESFAMDVQGTVYNVANLITPGNFAHYQSLTAPLLDSLMSPADEVLFSLGRVSGAEIMRALSMDSVDQFIGGEGNAGDILPNPDSPFRNIRYVVAKIVDTLDAQRFFPEIGLKRLHVLEYKCTVYYESDLNGSSEAVIYLSRSHLDQVSSDDSQPVLSSMVTAPAISQPLSQTALIRSPQPPGSFFGNEHRYDTIHSITEAPDGTLYWYGGDYDGFHNLSTGRSPLALARLVPGGFWRQLRDVYEFAVGTDNTLYMLDANHRLLKVRPGRPRELVLATDVRHFTLAPDGTLTAQLGLGLLLQWRIGGTHRTLLAVRVQSFSMAADGAILALTRRGELKRFEGSRTVTLLQQNVDQFGMRADGSAIILTRNGELKQLSQSSSAEPGDWLTLARSVKKFTLLETGELYALNTALQLMQLTERNHWTVLHEDVLNYVVSPDVFQNVYVQTTSLELKRREAGLTWVALEQGIRSLTIDTDGVVMGAKANGQRYYFYSSHLVPLLSPGSGPGFVSPPAPEEVLWAAGLLRDGVPLEQGSFVYQKRWGVLVEQISEPDETDQPRVYDPGGPAVLHHLHYRCTIVDQKRGNRETIVYLDRDYLEQVAAVRSEGAL